jgi:hypothetical protein
VAQVHTTLALTAATMLNPEGRQQAAAAAFQPSPPAGIASHSTMAILQSVIEGETAGN